MLTFPLGCVSLEFGAVQFSPFWADLTENGRAKCRSLNDNPCYLTSIQQFRFKYLKGKERENISSNIRIHDCSTMDVIGQKLFQAFWHSGQRQRICCKVGLLSRKWCPSLKIGSVSCNGMLLSLSALPSRSQSDQNSWRSRVSPVVAQKWFFWYFVK
jgi:hypothetical protein